MRYRAEAAGIAFGDRFVGKMQGLEEAYFFDPDNTLIEMRYYETK